MEQYYKLLGKVGLSFEGEWDNLRPYERLSYVSDINTGLNYVSKIDVPIGIDITNFLYWQPIGSIQPYSPIPLDMINTLFEDDETTDDSDSSSD